MNIPYSMVVDCDILNLLVTQPMLQRRPNCTELRLMDSYIQILCRFQKCKRKVPPPSPLKKFCFWGPKEKYEKKNRGDGGGTFCLHFWNVHKIWIKESIDHSSV